MLAFKFSSIILSFLRHSKSIADCRNIYYTHAHSLNKFQQFATFQVFVPSAFLISLPYSYNICFMWRTLKSNWYSNIYLDWLLLVDATFFCWQTDDSLLFFVCLFVFFLICVYCHNKSIENLKKNRFNWNNRQLMCVLHKQTMSQVRISWLNSHQFLICHLTW